MNKKIIILLVLFFLILCGCSKKKNEVVEKFYLDSEYYNKGDYIKVNSKDLEDIKNGSFLLFTYNNYCTLKIPCENIFSDFINQYNIAIVSIKFEDFKNTDFYEKVKFAPSVLVIKDGNIIAYLDAESDNDIDKYQDVSKFKEWVEKYIYLKGE